MKNTGKAMESFPVKRILPEINESHQKHNTSKGCLGATKTILDQIRPLFKMPYIVSLAITCYMQFSTFISSSGMGLWFTYLSNQISRSSATGTLCEILRGSNGHVVDNLTSNALCNDTISEKAFEDSVLIGVYYLITLILIAIFVQRIGRGIILLVTFFTACCAGYLVLWVTNTSVAIILFSLLLFLPGCSISLVSGSVVHLFPTSVRSTALGLMLMTGRIATSLGTNIIGATIQPYCEEAFFTVTSIVLG